MLPCTLGRQQSPVVSRVGLRWASSVKCGKGNHLARSPRLLDAGFCYTRRMSWANERRTFILVILGLIGATVLSWVIIAAIFKEPTCADGAQNQDEQGVDCGGSCAYLCSALLPSPVPEVSFARALSLPGGRTDVIAYISNENPSAAVKGARYTIEMFSDEQTLVATHAGVVDIPASSEIPVYIPNLFSGNQTVSNVFLTFDTTSLWWKQRAPEEVRIQTGEVNVSGTTNPRVTATLINNTATALTSTKFIATIFDSAGNAIAASQTVVTSIGAFSEAQAVFTWNQAFSAVPARVDVRPVVVLP